MTRENLLNLPSARLSVFPILVNSRALFYLSQDQRAMPILAQNGTLALMLGTMVLQGKTMPLHGAN